MGVFKSMRDLTHQAREVERSLPPVGERRDYAEQGSGSTAGRGIAGR